MKVKFKIKCPHCKNIMLGYYNSKTRICDKCEEVIDLVKLHAYE